MAILRVVESSSSSSSSRMMDYNAPPNSCTFAAGVWAKFGAEQFLNAINMEYHLPKVEIQPSLLNSKKSISHICSPSWFVSGVLSSGLYGR